MMFETWLQLALQIYLICFYYQDIRIPSVSQLLSLFKAGFILVPLTLKAIIPNYIFTKLPQETWIVAIKRMVWITFKYFATVLVFTLNMAGCISSLEKPVDIWNLSSSVLICAFYLYMSSRGSGNGRLKCYTLCLLFFIFGSSWTLGLVSIKETPFRIENLDDLSFIMLNTVFVVIFAKSANSIKNLHGNIKFIEENPDYMLLHDFELISRVVNSIGLKSTSKLPNMYFCSLIMMTLLLTCCTILTSTY